MENQPAQVKKTNRTLFIAIGALILVVLGGIAVVKSLSQPPPPTEEEETQVELLPADPNIVVELSAARDKRSVDLSVSKIPAGTVSVEYELSYNTGEGLPKGALGKISLNSKTEVERNILLGTCSTGGKCSYDTGVTSVKLVLRFNHPDGATQFSKEYPLE